VNLYVVSGVVKEAKVISGRTKFLAAKIIVREAGFGVNASKVYSKTVKAISFGKNVDALAAQLQPGTLVRVVGRPEIELYENKAKETKAVLKCVGQIDIELFSDEPTPPPQAEEQQGQESDPAPAAEDDGHF
jgi:single-stranded DNA-binding protein